MKFKIAFLIIVTINLVSTAFAQPMDTIRNALALTPPMGWNSWNTFKKNPSEALIEQMADAMVSTGLKDAGYSYINIDDFWSTWPRYNR